MTPGDSLVWELPRQRDRFVGGPAIAGDTVVVSTASVLEAFDIGERALRWETAVAGELEIDDGAVVVRTRGGASPVKRKAFAVSTGHEVALPSGGPGVEWSRSSDERFDSERAMREAGVHDLIRVPERDFETRLPGRIHDWAIRGDTIVARSAEWILAFSLGDGRELYRVEDEGVPDTGSWTTRRIGVGDDVIVFYGPRQIVCRELATGTERWRAPHKVMTPYGSAPFVHGDVAYCYGSSRGGCVQGYSLDDGALCYSAGKGFAEAVTVEGRWMAIRTEHGKAVRIYGPADASPLDAGSRPTRAKQAKPRSATSSLRPLEKALGAKPSSRAFQRIAKCLDELDAARLDAALASAELALAAWPDALRVAPRRWLERVLAGEHEPRVRIARALPSVDLRAQVTVEGAERWAALDLDGDELRLRRSELPQAAIAALLGVKPRWRTVSFTKCALGDAGVRAIAQSEAARGIGMLDLRDSGIGSAGAAALAETDRLARLVSLTLRGNPIGDNGAGALAASSALASLKYLDLNRCKIRDAGCEALAMAAWRLDEIVIADNPFTASGAIALSGSPTLSEFYAEQFYLLAEELASKKRSD